MKSQQRHARSSIVDIKKVQQDIGDTGNGTNQQKCHARAQKCLLLSTDSDFVKNIKSGNDSDKQGDCNRNLQKRHRYQYKNKKDNDTQVDEPERRILKY